MKRLKAAYRRILGRLAWTMLRAAEFDVIAQDLMQACETYADPAAVIPRRLSELAGADNRLEGQLRSQSVAISGLRDKIEELTGSGRTAFCEGDPHHFVSIVTKQVAQTTDFGRTTISHFETTLFCSKCGCREPINSVEVKPPTVLT